MDPIVVEPKSSSTLKTFFLIFGGFLLLITLGATLFYVYLKRQEAATAPTPPPFQSLSEKSDSFRQGQQLLLGGKNSAEAQALFEQSLADADTAEEEAQAKFKIADAKYQAGNVSGAIADLKEGAANEKYGAKSRAYAVEFMALMFVAYGHTVATAEIFKDEPYKSMYDPKDIFLSYRKLFEYSSSFYPLAVSQARIADWYANRILALLKKEKNPSAETLREIDVMKGVIHQNISNINLDIERIKSLPSVSIMVPMALERKAIVVGKMVRAGDISFGDPDTLFEESHTAHLSRGVYDGYNFFHYASFLALAHGEKRKTDIQKLLSNYYTSDKYKGTAVFDFFTQEKNNVLGVKSVLVTLSALDPTFKKLLVELGWKF